MTFAYQLDPVDPTLMHFRMDGTTANWLSVMIVPATPADFNKGDSMTAYTNAAGAWVLEDQTGHPFNGNMADTLPANRGTDNLLAKVVWPIGGGVAAAWSRKLSTGDTAADQVIPQGARCPSISHDTLSS